MIRLDQVGSTGAVDRKRVGRRRQTGLEIGEPTDSLSTLSAWYYEANVRSNVPPERERERDRGKERERENLPIHFYRSLSISKFRHLSPLLIYPTLSIAKHLPTLSSPPFSRSICAPSGWREEAALVSCSIFLIWLDWLISLALGY